MSLILVGMVGTLREQAQDLLTYHFPVIRDDSNGKFYVPTQEVWTPDDLRPMRDGDQKFLTMLNEEHQEIIRPGQLVFVVGATFYNRCSRIGELTKFSDGFQSWEILSGPYSWRPGTREEFGRLNANMLNVLLPAFYRSLFSPFNGGFIGDPERYFWILERLSAVPESDTLLARAIYYRERRDADRYELVVEWSRVHGYESRLDFEDAVERRVGWLRETRLEDLANLPSGSGAPSGGPRAHEAGIQSETVRSFLDELVRDGAVLGRDATLGTALRRGDWRRKPAI